MKVSKSTLKARLLEYLRHLEETGEEVIITDHRVPVARIVPYEVKQTAAQVFQHHRGKVKYHEDILEPTQEEWVES